MNRMFASAVILGSAVSFFSLVGCEGGGMAPGEGGVVDDQMMNDGSMADESMEADMAGESMEADMAGESMAEPAMAQEEMAEPEMSEPGN